MTLELVVLGNLLVDDIVFPDGTTRMGQAGGATLYASLGAALWGLRVGVASVRGEDYPVASLTALTARGVDLEGVRPMGGPGVRTWLLYEGDRRQVVHHLGRPSHAQASPQLERLPRAWLAAGAFHLAPMPFEVQRELVAGLSELSAFVSLDPYLLLRPDTLDDLRALARHVDAFFISEDEMEIAEGRADPRPILRSFATGRLRFAVYKRGDRGGVLYDARADRFVEWTPRAECVVDQTGAGDAFAAGFLAGWLRHQDLEAALQRAVVGASFAIEAWGAERLLSAGSTLGPERLRAWYGTHASADCREST